MTISELIADTHFLCGSTSATYPTVDLIRNINIEYNNVARLIWTSAGGWQFDDTNATTLPTLTTTLVASQQDYTLPATVSRLEAVSVKDGGGDWFRLKQVEVNNLEIAQDEFISGTGLPQYYDMVGNSILLYPSPDAASCTLSAGLEINVSRNVTEFAVSATSTVPGFATPFHRMLSYAAAIDFTQDQNERQLLVAMKDRLEKGLVNFYAKRDVESPTIITPHAKSGWRRYT